jgi:glutathione S-transferase
MMLTLIGPKFGRTLRVLWTLEELELDYDHLVTNPHSDDVYRVNPLGQIPALRDGKHVLTDSLAIMNYLADKTGSLGGQAGTPDRALIDARINFILTEMEAPIWLMARHGFVLPKKHRAKGMRAVAEADFARAEAKFDTLIGDNPYFAGDRFTLADIFAADLARWASGAKITLTSDRFKAHFARMADRPGWRRAIVALA